MSQDIPDFGTDPHYGDVEDEGRLAPGLVLDGRYEILREIGEGAAGMVYQARHRLIDRTVAVKVLNASLKDNADSVRRFINEGRAAGGLGHAHIVESTDMGYTPAGCPYLVLEYLEGRDVWEEVEALGPFELRRALRIVAQTASALAAAHAKGIVHRDVKPDNIYLVQRLGHDDHVKVLDFGVSKFSGAGMTKKGALYGTAEFMAPEQISATEMVDARADVYGLGLSLYFMLTGHLPFEGLPVAEMLIAIVSAEPAPLSQWRADLPEEVHELVERCMAKRPEERFQTMMELESALLQMLGPASMSEVPPPSSRSPAQVTSDVEIATAHVAKANVSIMPAPSTMPPPSIVPPSMLTTERRDAPGAWRRWLGMLALGAVVVTTAFVGARSLREPVQLGPAEGPSEVRLEVNSKVGSTMTFRGRQFVLPYAGEFPSSATRERVDVAMPDGAKRTFWVVLDRPRSVAIAEP